MRFSRSINVIGVHCEGEIGSVITGGIIHVPGSTMLEKLNNFKRDQLPLRNFLLQEPRGVVNKNINLLCPPTTPDGDFGMIIMEADDFAPMSGSNAICTTTAVLESGILPMSVPITEVKIDTAVGRVLARATCSETKVESVEIENVPSFVAKLDLPVHVPGLGDIKVDIAWGGIWFAFIRIDNLTALDVDIALHSDYGSDLVKLGQQIKKAIRKVYEPIHPTSPYRSVEQITFTTPLEHLTDGTIKSANATIVEPGRCDRSPCGTGTSARLAIMYARGEIQVGQTFIHESIVGTQFISRIKATATVGEGQEAMEAIVPVISGRAWVFGYQQYVLDPTDPFPEGFRCGDVWPSKRQT